MPEMFENDRNVDMDITEELHSLVHKRRICKMQLWSSFSENEQNIHTSVKRRVGNQICKITRILANLLKWLDFDILKISVAAQHLCRAFSYKMPSLTVLVLNKHLTYSKDLICKIAYNCPNLRHINLPHCDVAYDDVLLYFAKKKCKI